jgi:thiol-disulfide isomerase/thioredoxin
VRRLWHSLYFPSERKLKVSFYLGDRPDPADPTKNRIVNSDYVEFALAAETPAAAARDVGKASKSPAERYQAILDSFAKKQQEIINTFQKSKSDSDMRRGWNLYLRSGKEFAPAVLKLVQTDPKQDFAVDALAWLVANAHDTPEASQAVDLMLRDHPKSNKLATICDSLGEFHSAIGERQLRNIIDQSTDHEVRGRATFNLGLYFMRRAEPAADYQTDEISKDNREASACFSEVVAKYGDLKHWQGTLKRAAEKNVKEIELRSLGRRLPDVHGTTVDGQPIKLSDYAGKVVFLDFWGTWCPPCMLMVPHERALATRMKGKPFQILGVNADKDRQKFKQVCSAMGMTWPSFFEGDVGGPIAGTFNLYNYPTAYLIDHRGIIRWKYRAPPDEEQLDRAVDQLVKEAERVKK